MTTASHGIDQANDQTSTLPTNPGQSGRRGSTFIDGTSAPGVAELCHAMAQRHDSQ